MRYLFFVFCSLIMMIIFLQSACTRDSIEPISGDCEETITYEMHIKTIVHNTCAYAGCHNGTAPGDFSTYSGMESVIDNGKFRKNVIIEQLMPPPDATEGPTNLTEEQLVLMLCWADQGYLEN